MKSEVSSSSASLGNIDSDGSNDSSRRRRRPTAGSGWSPKSAFLRISRKLCPSSPTKTEQQQEQQQQQQQRSLSIVPQISELERVFNYFDEDGDGKISAAELQSCVRGMGGELSLAEAEDAVALIDSDGDGLLGLDDFGKLMEANGEEEEKKRDLREAFGMYEMEGSGYITPKSLKMMLSRLGESKTIQDCKAIIRLFDLNSDGVLSFEEFRVMMMT